MLKNSKKNLLDNEVKVTTCSINDKNAETYPHIDIKIGNGTVKWVIDPRSGISLITEDLYANLLSQGREMLEMKLQSEALLTAFRGMSQRIKKQTYIPFNIGDDCYEHVFLVSGQLVIFLLIDVVFLQEYGFVVNFKTNCLMYEIEGTINE